MLKRLLLAVLLLCSFACEAAVYALPWGPKPQFVDANGAPMSGGSLKTYQATTTTLQATYTDSTGGVANPTTITLNTRGETPNEVWLSAGLSYKLVLLDSSGSTVWTVDNITGVNDVTGQLGTEWVASGLTPTFVSTTSFTVVGDQTQTLQVGRRLKTTNSGGTIYSTITASSFAAATTVTVVNDAGSIDSGISAVSYGLLSATNPAVPLLVDTFPIVSGSADKTKKVRLEADGISASTTRVVTAPDYDVRLSNLPAGIGCLPYSGSTIPTGWLECDGSAVSRTTYAALFAAISTTWGVGDGSTTFNVPDLRGRTPVGAGTGTVAETVAAASVNTGADTFTVSSNTAKWITGQAVVLTTTGGLPAGLSLLTTYYVIRDSSTTIKFATTLANAQNGTAIDITTQGTGNDTVTGTLTARALAEVGGEESHAMTSTELLSHTHASNNVTGISSAGAVGLAGGASAATVVANTATGGNAAMNNMQPFAVTKFIITYHHDPAVEANVECIGMGAANDCEYRMKVNGW